jgi:two-component system sensor kinase FixL
LAANPRWAVGVGYVLAYVLLDALSFVQPLLKLGITPWTPQAGLTVAFLLWRGWRQAPWTLLAALVAEVVVRGSPAPLPALLAASASIAVGYGALAFVLSRCAFAFPVAARRDAAMLVLGTAIAAAVVSVGYVGAFVSAGLLPVHDSGAAVARYWVGDLNGVVTLAPLLLAWPGLRERLRAAAARWRLCAAQGLLLAAVLWLVFGVRAGEELQFVYALFVPIVWISLTWGVVGATFATLLIQVGLMVGAQQGLAMASVLDVQFLLATLGTTALLLGAVVAERGAALERVAAREAEQRALLAAAPDAVLSTDGAGTVVSANPAAERLFGAPARTLLGAPMRSWVGELRVESSGGRAQVRVRRLGAEAVPAEIAWVRLDPPAGPGYLLLVRDVSEREQAQAQLRERDTALARAMRFALAGELATALTHELNQPITALVSYLRAVEILSRPLDSRDARLAETLGKANREAMRAADVLKRLRDFYVTGAVRPSAVELPALVDEVLASFAERAARQGVELRRDLGDVGTVTTDRLQLQMTLHNLIGNALDATAGVERVRWVRVAADCADGRLRIAVEDSGRGIGADVAQNLFEPFVTDKADGMGLGLAISRSLMKSQGGDLRLEHSGAEGTRFVIDLPAGARRKAAA